MGFSNLISWFIIITTAATLNAHGVTDIQTSSQAAEALRPIAGEFTFVVFAFGIIGIGLLAVPVLAGSAAYALGEALGWPTGLSRRPKDAKAFYGTIAVATLVGVFINFVHLDPIKALFWSAVINGVVAVPLMVVIMLMARQPRVMGAIDDPAAIGGDRVVDDRRSWPSPSPRCSRPGEHPRSGVFGVSGSSVEPSSGLVLRNAARSCCCLIFSSFFAFLARSRSARSIR